jgi:hypothetical protein
MEMVEIPHRTGVTPCPHDVNAAVNPVERRTASRSAAGPSC